MSETIYDFFDDPEATLLDAEQRACSKWEMDFVAGLRDRFESFGQRTFMSQKQADVLERIAGGSRGFQ